MPNGAEVFIFVADVSTLTFKATRLTLLSSVASTVTGVSRSMSVGRIRSSFLRNLVRCERLIETIWSAWFSMTISLGCGYFGTTRRKVG